MLDAPCSFTGLDDVHISWGACLGTPDEILVSGPVAEVGDHLIESVEGQGRSGLRNAARQGRKSPGSDPLPG
ncbi:hypothetical protein [Nonomuraea diastatica]|uniref:Uncharacterized protein n=1 Tax=Nonomuraea diastatica TaxID=1848329 RepID=A0A4R4WY07_9ACTN|nr:hypothetical protein [Nonomuraea diastatica]TDD22709.1 hypothetical protein E1294_11005 [Nonomuraea diastatica]